MHVTEAKAILLPGRERRAEIGLARRALTLARRQPLGVAGGIIIVAFLLIALTAPLLSPNDPRAFVGPRLSGPSQDFPFGTNNLGQDVLSRTIYGSQVSLAVGVASVLIGTLLGTSLGLLAGYFGRWVDMVVQRSLEVVAAFPGLMLILVVIAALGRPHLERDAGLFSLTWQLRVVVIAIGVGFVFATTRIVRSAVIAERHSPYVEAAQACGATWPRVVLRHLLPNVMAYVIVGVSVTLGLAILIEASLSFLGYGVPPGTPSWGADLSGPNRGFFLEHPYLVLAPGGAISLTLLGFNLLGDALRDVLDPRLRGR
jgi:peptide/nickel transport system permease protein